MWTAEITSSTKNPDGLTLTLVYAITDGATTEQITEARVPSKESAVQVVQNALNYKNRVQSQIDGITNLDTSILLGDLPTVTGRVFPPVDPDPVEVERAAFQLLLTNYQIALHGEALGLAMAPGSAQVLSEIQITWNNWSDIQQSMFKGALLGLSL